jgi:aconitate decarboxylase
MMAYIDRPYPEDGLDGKFSWQYTTACALLDGKVVMNSFTNKRRFAPDMDGMLGRIDVEMHDDITGNFDEMYVIAEATLDDGSTVTARCDGPRGKWGTPPILEEDHLVKVRDCLSLKYEENEREEIIALASKFDELSADQIKNLMGKLAG